MLLLMHFQPFKVIAEANLPPYIERAQTFIIELSAEIYLADPLAVLYRVCSC